jgi:hypothetical protein
MMRERSVLFNCCLASVLFAMSLFLTGELARASEAVESDVQNIRESSMRAIESPQAISFISSLTPMCYKPQVDVGDCYINFNSITVSTSVNMVSMMVKIDSRVRAYYAGFFQNSFDVPFAMHGQGFKVTCGAKGSGGKSNLGRSHAYMIQAEDSDGLKATNNGTVFCPPHPY